VFGSPSPSALLEEQLTTLLGCLPGITNGIEDDVHKGRVATRRMHETLMLVRSQHPEKADALIKKIRSARRALGAVRDADTAQHLLEDLEAQTEARDLVDDLRTQVGDEQRRTRRKLIKRLEVLDLQELPELLAGLRRSHLRILPGGPKRGWRPTLRAHVSGRAKEARGAIEHATGVYFPNRAHSARVALKKLRYAIELAKATNTWSPPHGLAVLREVQDTLGDTHDREVLMERIREIAATRSSNGEADGLLRHLVDDTLRLHGDYLARRDAVLEIVNAAEHVTHNGRARVLLAATAVALPSALLLNRAAGAQR